MRLLLDTHVFVWAVVEPERIGEPLAAMQNERNALLLSAVASWELAIKAAIGRFDLSEAVRTWVPRHAARFGCSLIDVTHAQALAVAELPMHHRDPFDRLLVAQAVDLGATIVTADAVLQRYDVDVLLVN